MEPSLTVFNDMMSKVKTFSSYTGGRIVLFATFIIVPIAYVFLLDDGHFGQLSYDHFLFVYFSFRLLYLCV